MKNKVYFIIAMVMLFILGMVVTPDSNIEYNFPLDNGMNKLLAATLSLVVSLWGAVSKKGMKLILAVALVSVMLYCFGIPAMFAAMAMYAVAVKMVSDSPELKDFIEKPFAEEK